MPRWRTSTWVYALIVVAAIVAEVIYATSSDPLTQDHQGAALAWLLIASVLFGVYRAMTRGRHDRSD